LTDKTVGVVSVCSKNGAMCRRGQKQLPGKPKPEWMEKGVPYLERGRRDVTELFRVQQTPRVTTESAVR